MRYQTFNKTSKILLISSIVIVALLVIYFLVSGILIENQELLYPHCEEFIYEQHERGLLCCQRKSGNEEISIGKDGFTYTNYNCWLNDSTTTCDLCFK